MLPATRHKWTRSALTPASKLVVTLYSSIKFVNKLHSIYSTARTERHSKTLSAFVMQLLSRRRLDLVTLAWQMTTNQLQTLRTSLILDWSMMFEPICARLLVVNRRKSPSLSVILVQQFIFILFLFSSQLIIFIFIQFLLGRPYGVTGGLIKCSWCFFSFFIQPHTLIPNISGTAQDIQNRKTNWSRAIPPAFEQRGPVNFGPQMTEIYMWVWTH